MTAFVSLLFITMIPIDCKIKNFPNTCVSMIMEIRTFSQENITQKMDLQGTLELLFR